MMHDCSEIFKTCIWPVGSNYIALSVSQIPSKKNKIVTFLIKYNNHKLESAYRFECEPSEHLAIINKLEVALLVSSEFKHWKLLGSNPDDFFKLIAKTNNMTISGNLRLLIRDLYHLINMAKANSFFSRLQTAI